MVLQPDRTASQHGGEAGNPGTAVATSASSPTRPRMDPVPVAGGELRAAAASGGGFMAVVEVRDLTASVSETSWRSVTCRSAVTVARPSRSAAALSSALLNRVAVSGTGRPRDAVKAASILSGPGGRAPAGGRTAGSDTGSSGADPTRRDSSRTPGISAAARPRTRTAACSVIHVPSSGQPSGSSRPRSSRCPAACVHASVSTSRSPPCSHGRGSLPVVLRPAPVVLRPACAAGLQAGTLGPPVGPLQFMLLIRANHSKTTTISMVSAM